MTSSRPAATSSKTRRDFFPNPMETVLITGVTGFTGRQLAMAIKRRGGARIVGLARRTQAVNEADPWDELVSCDVTHRAGVRDLVRAVEPDFLFHLASESRSQDGSTSSVVEGARSVLDAVRELVPSSPVLLVGSAAEYGWRAADGVPLSEDYECQPVTPYAEAKLAATRLGIEQFERVGTRVVVARPFNIVGAGIPSWFAVGAIIERLHEVRRGVRSIVTVGNLSPERDFVAVEDVVEAYLRLVREASAWGQIVNLCSGRPTAIRDVLGRLMRLAKVDPAVETDPALVRASEIPRFVGSYAKAQKLIGFEPRIELGESLRSAWDESLARIGGDPRDD
jgi:GDP-4-dehydro-6-deoxy-D-mannose reductase